MALATPALVAPAPVGRVAPAEPPRNADGEAALEARIRDAVQAAVHYPAAARMMGLTGRARLQLDYRAGVVTSSTLVQSAGTPVLDDAALSAARSAHYPPAPTDLGDRPLRFLVWVEFRPG